MGLHFVDLVDDDVAFGRRYTVRWLLEGLVGVEADPVFDQVSTTTIVWALAEGCFVLVE